MLNIRSFISRCAFFTAITLCSQASFADNSVDYSSVDVGALQNQYQKQLTPKAPRKAVTRKPAKRAQINAKELLEYQRLLGTQSRQKQQARRQVVKQPVRQVQRQAPRVVQRQVQPRVQRPVARAPQPRVARAPAPRRDAIFEAASRGDVRLIGQLIQQGANVNQANNERETALHMAAAKGHYSAVIYLLNHGANINSRTINNWLPIHHATRFRHAQIANYLKQRGSPIYAKTSDGLSAVDMARAVNDRRILGIFGVR